MSVGILDRRLDRPAARCRRPVGGNGRHASLDRRAPDLASRSAGPGRARPTAEGLPAAGRGRRRRLDQRRGRRLRPDRTAVGRASRSTAIGSPACPTPRHRRSRCVCLDTETTGLATGDRHRRVPGRARLVGGRSIPQVQLLLPDQAGSRPARCPRRPARPDGWLVTYNGRSFDWPLLVARFRMNRRSPPALAGHLDLLPFVRRIFRHRLTRRPVEDGRDRAARPSARATTSRAGRSRGATSSCCAAARSSRSTEVVRHNHEDVRSLARLIAHADDHLGAAADRRIAPVGDLFGLARAYRRTRPDRDALDCLDVALEAGPMTRDPTRARSVMDDHPYHSSRCVRRNPRAGRPRGSTIRPTERARPPRS